MTTVKRVARLRKAGIFADFTHPPEVPNFRRYNLIYGFNGSGKTTLSRVLRCLETGKYPDQLGDGSEFQIDLHDGSSLSRSNFFGPMSDRLLVFNSDFVSENLYGAGDSLSPIYYIGKDQASQAKLLERYQAALERRRLVAREVRILYEKSQSEFSNFKRDLGRLIAEQLNLGRRYTATNVVSDYQAFNQDAAITLSEDDRIARKAVINQVSPPDALPELTGLPEGIQDTLQRCVATLSAELAIRLDAALQSHRTMMAWAKHGLDYHREHELDTCLFCSSGLTAARLAQLSEMLDGPLVQAIADISDSRGRVEELANQISAMRRSVPGAAQFAPELVERAKVAIPAAEAALTKLEELASATQRALQAKAETPDKSMPLPALMGGDEIEGTLAEVGQCFRILADLVGDHNGFSADFAKAQARAREEIKNHHLLENTDRYRQIERTERALGDRLIGKLNLVEMAEKRVREVRERVMSHGPAVEVINDLLAGYLNHKELSIESVGEGYRIKRTSSASLGALSEGERTALALCYFLSKIAENGRNKEDTVVVLDDPISSLDSKALNYAFNLIKRSLIDCSQLFILTHNANFMNEAKKWLKPLATRDQEGDRTATLCFLEVRAIGPDARRVARIIELPRLLREYESEYHYLFSLVMRFTEDGDEHHHLWMLMPNVMRKVLEIFFAFKEPGSEGLEAKLKSQLIVDCGVDQVQLAAVARLAQVESHGDNLEDLTSFSAMTLEESLQAAVGLLHVISQIDPHHSTRMRRICR